MTDPVWHCHLAMSLDGNISRPDGSFDWLTPYPPQEFDIDAYHAEIDAVVIGRSTYEIERAMTSGRTASLYSSSPAGLGDGIPLLPAGTTELPLHLVKCEPKSGGALHVVYRRKSS